MNTDELAVIEARAAAATPGEWEFYLDHLYISFERYGVMTISEIPICRAAGGIKKADAIFIAYSRTDIPALIAEVRRLQAGLAAIEARWREASRHSSFKGHYRKTMELCADELRDLLGGVDDSELQSEIDKAIKEGEL